MKQKLEYEKYKSKKNLYEKKVNIIASIRLITFIILLFSFIGKYYYLKNLLTIIFILSLIIFIILIIIHDKYYKIYDYYEKYSKIIETYLKRENGNWKEFKDTGSDFLENCPYYYQDLDIFGQNSLFQLISICKTQGGREKLKERLSNKEYSNIELKNEQNAIEELSNNPKLIIELNILLDYFDNKNINISKTFSKIKTEEKSNTLDIIISITCSIICIILLILGVLKIIKINYFYAIFLFNFMISWLYSYIFKENFKELENLIKNYKGINEIFKKITSESFTSEKLNKMRARMKDAKDSGVLLERLDTLNSLRNNLLASFFMNGFFCVNLILLSTFSNFEKSNLSKIQVGIAEIEELEAISSLATIGIIFKNKCMPSLTENVNINFNDLIHPLLGEKICIPNSFSSNNGINIITGSNMGGKTSFLRTIGVNIILMNSGSYVCAKNFSASYFKVFTSMRVFDDISNGISTFYGELLRIKDMVEYVNKGNMLVLIDEIFKGTNYQDRIYGAKEVIKKLNKDKVIVILTTHDFELCDQEKVKNYHVQETYNKDKIVFDYKIKEGKCTSTNARYLMTKLGIINK